MDIRGNSSSKMVDLNKPYAAGLSPSGIGLYHRLTMTAQHSPIAEVHTRSLPLVYRSCIYKEHLCLEGDCPALVRMRSGGLDLSCIHNCAGTLDLLSVYYSTKCVGRRAKEISNTHRSIGLSPMDARQLHLHISPRLYFHLVPTPVGWLCKGSFFNNARFRFPIRFKCVDTAVSTLSHSRAEHLTKLL